MTVGGGPWAWGSCLPSQVILGREGRKGQVMHRNDGMKAELLNLLKMRGCRCSGGDVATAMAGRRIGENALKRRHL